LIREVSSPKLIEGRAMKFPRRQFLHLAAGGAALPAVSRIARAQTYPTRPVTLIVPYPAGGGVDTMGRIIAQKLSGALGQQVIIENRPGAGGVIGMRTAAKAAPDGYTLVMTTTGISLPANTGYDVGKDFAPVGIISSTPIVLIAHPSLPAKSLADVIALAKKEPGKLTVGTPPPPTLTYFAAELFKAMTGIALTVVPLDLRPDIPIPHGIEHDATILVAGFLFGIACIGREWMLNVGGVVFWAAIEALCLIWRDRRRRG
jgi:hypothetical protein